MTVEPATERHRGPGAELREPPPAAGAVPLLGHGWRLARDPLAFMTRLRDDGEVVRLRLGPKTVYAVTTPQLTGEVALSPHYAIAGPLWESLEGLLGKEGVATANGPLHRRQRRTMQPAFRLDAIPGYGPVMVEEAYALVERWRSAKVVDMTSESFRLAVRVAARCLMRGGGMDAQADRICAAFTTLFRGMYRRMVLPLGPLHRVPLPGNREFDRALSDLHRLVDEIVADRRASGHRPDDLLTALLEARGEDGEPIGEQEIHDQVVAVLTPGSETMGATLMSLMLVLTEHPEIGDGVRDEVSSVVGDRPLTIGDVPRLAYTASVVVETMRLHPAVWVLTRRATTGTDLGGYHLPAGADVIYSPYAIQRDPRSYDRGEVFDPGRWTPERAREIPKYAMRPFGLGNRKCPSDHFSMAELTLVTAVVAAAYRFEHAPGSDPRMRIGITLRPRRLLLRPSPR
ncbi:cytochrome P450 [Streptomyces sp. ZYX-F-203]